MASASHSAAPSPAAPFPTAPRAVRNAMDASVKAPVLLFLGFALLWLLVNAGFALIASIQLHSPGFLADCAWFTHGRVQAAESNSLLFGWGVNAGLAVALWLLARLAHAPLPRSVWPLVAGVFWNVGLALGIGGILIGDSTSLEWLEIPGYATPLLLAAYAIVATWALALLRTGAGRARSLYVSQWFLLVALLAFPWLYSVAQVMLLFSPVRGTVQAIVNAWWTEGVLNLWFTSVTLALIYYFLPKILGRPIRSYYLARFGFWSYVLVSVWLGGRALIGAPVPAWVQAVGTAASLLLLIPLFIISLNVHGAWFGHGASVRASTTLKFIVFAAISFTLATLLSIATAFQSLAETVHLTFVRDALTQWMLYGGFTMAVFGALYYLVPRLTLRPWPSAKLIGVHFVAAASGLLLQVAALGIGGIVQGRALNNPEQYADFNAVQAVTQPFLFAETLGVLLTTVGLVAFVVNVASMCSAARTAPADSTALFRNPPELEVVR